MANEYIAKDYAGAAAPTTLAGGSISGSALSFTAASGASYPDGSAGPFVVVFDRGLVTEEKVLCSARSGNVFTVIAGGRGYDGTTGQAHTVTTSTIEHCLDAYSIKHANAFASIMSAVGDLPYKGSLTGTGYARLAIGTNGMVLQSNGTTPTYGFVDTGNLSAALQALLLPAGMTSTTISATAPTGWLFHNQTVVNAQTLYPALWAVAPAAWKSGSSLVIPNLTDAVLSQAGTTALGATGGANTVTIGAANLPVHVHDIGHNHTQNSHVHALTDPGHVHTPGTSPTTNGDSWGFGGGGLGGWGVASENLSNNNIFHAGNTGASTTGITLGGQIATNQPLVGNSGNGGFANTAMSVRNAHLGVNIMIKAH